MLWLITTRRHVRQSRELKNKQKKTKKKSKMNLAYVNDVKLLNIKLKKKYSNNYRISAIAMRGSKCHSDFRNRVIVL